MTFETSTLGGALLTMILLAVIVNIWRISVMSDALNRLTTEVTELKTVNASAVALITGLAAQIRDAIDDEDALNALADDLDSQTNELAAAVTANTVTPAPAPNPAVPAPDAKPADPDA